MKTKGLNKLILTSLVLAAFTSCQEEEFYEKQFIDGAVEKYQRENRTIEEDDLAEQINDEDLEQNINPDEDGVPNGGHTDGSNGGSNDGSTDGSDDGSTDGSDDGSTDGSNGGSDDGSTDGSNGGSDNGSTDGSTGGSDDGSTDGSNGGSDSGSTDGSTGGSDDGSTDGSNGGSDDGSTDGSTGGSNDGSTDGSNDGSETNQPKFKLVSDDYTQKGVKAPIDILWVVDNSGSMHDEQVALANNFNAFINDFVTKDIDFQMAVTTTDRNRNKRINVKAEKDNLSKLTTSAMKANSEQFVSDFKDLVKVGTGGYGIEKGLMSSEVFTDVHANRFLREDAYFIIVYMSDERDQSQKDVEGHLKQLQKWKKNNGLLKTYSIVDLKASSSSRYVQKGYDRYEKMSKLTGGYIADINGDFHSVLSNMGESIADLADHFPLSEVPYDVNSIVVKVDGVESVEWEYSAEKNSIKFHSSAIPSDGAKIQVSYDVKE